MMLLSDTIVDFHLFYDGAVDIQIWALLTRSQCNFSDTQVTVKACGPLVFKSPSLFGILNFKHLASYACMYHVEKKKAACRKRQQLFSWFWIHVYHVIHACMNCMTTLLVPSVYLLLQRQLHLTLCPFVISSQMKKYHLSLSRIAYVHVVGIWQCYIIYCYIFVWTQLF